MIVLHLTDCPIALRGDLTRWLLEIASGVFVGQVSARVRDRLWQHIQKTCKTGRATMVYNAPGEQNLAFQVHGEVWEPIDFDGIRLMLRPSASRLAARQASNEHGFSNAAKRRKAKRFAGSKAKHPTDYVVVDIETTGLLADTDEIVEIGAIKVTPSEGLQTFHALLRIQGVVPPKIVVLTGITNEELAEHGRCPKEVLTEFMSFLDDLPFVAHNSNFDLQFLLHGCRKHGLPLIKNRCIDTLSLAKRALPNLPDYSLKGLAAHLDIAQTEAHRSLPDCETVRQVYTKLIKFLATANEESPI